MLKSLVTSDWLNFQPLSIPGVPGDGTENPNPRITWLVSPGVTKKDPMEPFQHRPQSHVLCFSFSLKERDDSIWCIYPGLFGRCWDPHQMEEISMFPLESGWNQEIFETTYCLFILPHHQLIRELCMSWPHTMQPSSLTRPLKTPPWNLAGCLDFLSISCSDSLSGTLQ